jgi:hypothetical protein
MSLMVTLFCVGSVSFCFVYFQMTPTANQVFLAFFESSIMRKIGPGSRPGSRACCVSGGAFSEGAFALNTPLVYFVSE